MIQDRRLPASLRQQLERALRLATELRDPQQSDEEIQTHLLDDLKSCVADALVEIRSSGLPHKDDIARPLKIANGILLYLTDPAQRDARGRLRDVTAQLRELLG